jgi:GrpB-like predicted nucleotidyltransferase (UPF0157 family)
MILGFIAFVCLLCAPFLLLPTILAFKNRKRARHIFLALNLLWFAAAAFISHGALTVLFALILWLLLLHFAIQEDVPLLADIDEDVELVNYDPAWPNTSAAERARLATALDIPGDDIEHIGSTAVPGLAAKPVIDMMLGVKKLPPRGELSRLGILGYQNCGAAGVPGRIYLRLRGDQHFNLHLVERGGEHWTNNLALRELLRHDPVAREKYAAGKRAALAQCGGRLLAYSAAKNAVLTELLAAARQR